MNNTEVKLVRDNLIKEANRAGIKVVCEDYEDGYRLKSSRQKRPFLITTGEKNSHEGAMRKGRSSLGLRAPQNAKSSVVKDEVATVQQEVFVRPPKHEIQAALQAYVPSSTFRSFVRQLGL